MSRSNSNTHAARPGRHMLSLQSPDEYFNKSRLIDGALSEVNHKADPSLTSVYLLQQKNELLRNEIARLSRMINESRGGDR